MGHDRNYRRGKTRSKGKKVSYAKAKKVVAKVHKKQKSKNMDTFALTAKNIVQLVPVQGLTVANYIYNFFSLIDNSTTAYSLFKNAEFIMYKNMYDQFRVNGVMIKCVPKANVLDQAYNQMDGTFTNNGDGVIHTVLDRDSGTPWNIPSLTRYPSYKKFNFKKSWSRKYNITWPKGLWLDCSSPFEDTTLLNRLGGFGGIGIYAENLLEEVGELVNEPVADVHIYYQVVFRGKTNTSLTLNDDGSVSIAQLDLGERPAYSTVVPTGGTFITQRILSTADTGLVVQDLSGNYQP